jgi:hypothetical protein
MIQMQLKMMIMNHLKVLRRKPADLKTAHKEDSPEEQKNLKKSEKIINKIN